MKDELQRDIETFVSECARFDSDCGEVVRGAAKHLVDRMVLQHRVDHAARIVAEHLPATNHELTQLVEFEPCRACKRLRSTVAIHSLSLLILAAFFAWFMFSMVGVMKP